ncbi:hypothetical protein NDU88_001200 [Pleurodeles waltl]|uniref:Uncharacterized protein n=1 Tax=Pleurodeles waltl TaxID=8319 RepID=A0AAV7SZN2_PLEWA|nr:hypothetical protein NDU88_001200 [Pleurodeles waltl]
MTTCDFTMRLTHARLPMLPVIQPRTRRRSPHPPIPNLGASVTGARSRSATAEFWRLQHGLPEKDNRKNAKELPAYILFPNSVNRLQGILGRVCQCPSEPGDQVPTTADDI